MQVNGESLAQNRLAMEYGCMHVPAKFVCVFLALAVLALSVFDWTVDGSCCGQPVTAGGRPSADPSPLGGQTGAPRAHPDSGIYGHMVTAWGNPPAEPPTYECVKVLAPTGQRVVATGTCAGLWGAFRIPLEPGQYIVETGGSWQTVGGAVRFVPRRRPVDIKAGEWLDLAPPTLPAPVP